MRESKVELVSSTSAASARKTLPRLDPNHSCVWRDYCAEHDRQGRMHIEKLRKARKMVKQLRAEIEQLKITGWPKLNG